MSRIYGKTEVDGKAWLSNSSLKEETPQEEENSLVSRYMRFKTGLVECNSFFT
jgi:hypothetical protein